MILQIVFKFQHFHSIRESADIIIINVQCLSTETVKK